MLQYHVTTYIDNRTEGIPPARHITGRKLNTIVQKFVRTNKIKNLKSRFFKNLDKNFKSNFEDEELKKMEIDLILRSNEDTVVSVEITESDTCLDVINKSGLLPRDGSITHAWDIYGNIIDEKLAKNYFLVVFL